MTESFKVVGAVTGGASNLATNQLPFLAIFGALGVGIVLVIGGLAVYFRNPANLNSNNRRR